MGPAPIALFVYNRPVHTEQTILALKACPEFAASSVFVFADGAKSIDGQTAVDETRDVVRRLLPHATLEEAAVNRGLGRSIIAGVGRLLERFGRIIVIEDDLVVDPRFLNFMNAALDRYATTAQVMQVSGFAPDVDEAEGKAALLPLTTSWGWATWSRAWEAFDPECKDAVDRLRDPAVRRRFDLDGVIQYARMFDLQRAGKVDSWAIRWYWAVFKAAGLVVYPPRSLVHNTGFDGSGTHGSLSASRLAGRSTQSPGLGIKWRFPDAIVEDSLRFAAVRAAMRRDFGGGNRVMRAARQLTHLVARRIGL